MFRCHRRSTISAAVLALVAWLLASNTVSAQPQFFIPFEGTQAFSNFLHFAGLQPLKSVAELKNAQPAQTLIVVFGGNEVLTELPNLKNFVNQGGAVLVASDHASLNRLQAFNVRIEGEKVFADWISAYKRQSHCPYVQRSQARNFDHPIFAGIHSPAAQHGAGVATNSPGYLHSPAATILGEFAADCSLGPRGPLPSRTFMVGSRGSDDERFLILASHSVFMNGMLGQSDNQNLQFAANCIEWLCQSTTGRRKFVFFAEDNSIAQELDVPLMVPMPPPTPPIATINRLLKKLEDENVFYRFLYGDDRFPGILDGGRVRQALILLLSLALLIYAGHRLIQALHRTDTTVPLPQAWTEEKLADPAPIVQRHRAVRQLGNYHETAQHLARQFFAPLLGPAVNFEPSVPPEIKVRGGWWRQRRANRLVRDLWQLACGETMFVSGARLRQAVRQMEALARIL